MLNMSVIVVLPITHNDGLENIFRNAFDGYSRQKYCIGRMSTDANVQAYAYTNNSHDRKPHSRHHVHSHAITHDDPHTNAIARTHHCIDVGLCLKEPNSYVFTS